MLQMWQGPPQTKKKKSETVWSCLFSHENKDSLFRYKKVISNIYTFAQVPAPTSDVLFANTFSWAATLFLLWNSRNVTWTKTFHLTFHWRRGASR